MRLGWLVLTLAFNLQVLGDFSFGGILRLLVHTSLVSPKDDQQIYSHENVSTAIVESHKSWMPLIIQEKFRIFQNKNANKSRNIPSTKSMNGNSSVSISSSVKSIYHDSSSSRELQHSFNVSSIRYLYKDINCSQHIAITFVNGIAYNKALFDRITHHMESIFGQQVNSFYNPSSGNFVNDLTNAGIINVLRPNDIQIAKDLSDHLRNILATIRPDGRVLHIAHSAGAIVTYLAARYHLSTEEKDRIDVVTFGGGRSITRKHFRGRIVNYYSSNDPLTIVDRRTAHLLHHHFKNNDTMVELYEQKHNTTFIFLRGMLGDPIMDHYMDGPTYTFGLHHEAEAYYKRVWSIVAKQARDRSTLRALRKKVANITGVHHFWDLQWLANMKQFSMATAANDSLSSSHYMLRNASRPLRRWFSRIIDQSSRN